MRRPAPPIYDYDDDPADVGVAGARIALRDMETTGRLTGQDFQLDTVILNRGQSAVEAAAALVAKGEGLIIADLPAADLLAVADALKGKPATLFNIQAEDDSLRNADCRANIDHFAPSRAMLTDALMQFVAAQKWRNVFLVVGKEPADQLYAAAVRRSVKKFGLKLTGDKPWTFGNLARERRRRADPRRGAGVHPRRRGRPDRGRRRGRQLRRLRAVPHRRAQARRRHAGAGAGHLVARARRLGLGAAAEPLRAHQQAPDAPARLPGLDGDPRGGRGGDPHQVRRPGRGRRLHPAARLRHRRLQGRAGVDAAVGPAAAPARAAGAAQDAGVGGARAGLPPPREPARHARLRQAGNRLQDSFRRQIVSTALILACRRWSGPRFLLAAARPPAVPLLGAAVLAGATFGAWASQPASAYMAYVTNEKDNTVSVVDTSTWKVVKTADVGRRPRGIIMSPDGKELYVCASDDDIIQVYDPKTMQMIRTLPSGPDPETFALSPDGKTLYVSNEDDNQVTVIDIPANKATAEIPVGVEPEGEGISPDGKTLVNTSETTNMASFIDTASAKIVANVLVDSRPRIAVFNGDGSKLWVSSEVGGKVNVIDTKTHQILKKITFAVPGHRRRGDPAGRHPPHARWQDRLRGAGAGQPRRRGQPADL